MKKWNKAKILVIVLLLPVFMFAGCGIFAPEVDDVVVLSAVFDEDFDSNGIITLNIVPIDVNGDLGDVRSVTAVATYTNTDYDEVDEDLDVDKEDTVNVDSSSLPWAIAVDIDSSGSMSSNDPDDLRIDATKLFVDNILEYDSTSEFNIYDFGAGTTTGFSYSRQLTDDWTSDETVIDAAVDMVVASGLTPLFDSVYEIIQAFNSEKSASSYQRAMLVLSDGSPNDYVYQQDVYDYAVANTIPINTVSLGTGSYTDTMRELAEETGGIYASAEDAEALQDAFEGLSLGTSEGYLVYTLTFRNPDEILSGSEISIEIEIIAKNYEGVKTVKLTR